MPSGADRVVKVDLGGTRCSREIGWGIGGRDSDELLSVLFTDLVGSTELSDRIGDAPAVELMNGLNELLARQFERFGGRVVKSTGDGFLVTFASVRRSIACAVAIQHAMAERNRRQPGQPLPVRIGSTAGEASIGRPAIHVSAVHAA